MNKLINILYNKTVFCPAVCDVNKNDDKYVKLKLAKPNNINNNITTKILSL